nr:IS630 family transposase [Treponema phagedenis]
MNLACQKPTTFGYAAETWTYALLTKHINTTAESAGYLRLATIHKTTVFKILTEADIKPYKIEYYCENRDPDFDRKMHNVLLVYKQLELYFEENKPLQTEEGKNIHVVSYDEKPGIQAIATTSDDLPADETHQCIRRDYEYKRLGTLSLLAGIDLQTGDAIPLVSDSHTSKDYVQFLKILDERYPQEDKIRIILDNLKVHTSKETIRYLSTVPGRFEFVFTPKHGLFKILTEADIKPYKIEYYCENRDPDFDRKMHNVLLVYKQLELYFEENKPLQTEEGKNIHVVSYDEKPGIQAIATTSDDLPADETHQCIRRDYEYKRLGTLSLLAGIDLQTGDAIPLVSDSHTSKDYVQFLKILDERYPQEDKIRIILDNLKVHTSKETIRYLSTVPGRFEFVFNLQTGDAIPLVSDSHTSKDYVQFLKILDERYPQEDKIRIILDNLKVHTSKETIRYLSTVPGRFEFVFTPKHGSWLNMIEGFFSKLTRQLLRGMRVKSKTELVNRLYKYFDEINEEPVVFHWKYNLDDLDVSEAVITDALKYELN